MSTRKYRQQTAPEPAAAATAEDLDPAEVVNLPSAGLEKIEVKSLELDERYEVDTDPYNRTGSHFVAALRRNDD